LEELENKLNDVLKEMNKTFQIEIDESESINDENIATKLVIKNITNDGSEFIEKFCSLFGPLITMVTENKELVYQEDTGLVINYTDVIDRSQEN
jgi:hypothetical protein